LATISRTNEHGIRGYGNTQFRYAMTYVLITLAALIFLNIYCSVVSQQLFYRNKESSMVEKCLLAAGEISNLEVINTDGILEVLEQLESESGTTYVAPRKETEQISFAAVGEGEVLDAIRRCQPETLTPIEAMTMLYELKQKLS
jgi:hypothetical protein